MRKGIACQENEKHRVLSIQIVRILIKCWVVEYKEGILFLSRNIRPISRSDAYTLQSVELR